MVILSRIYTRTGDHGHTRLVDNSLADKTDSRIEAYGTVDELNAVLGLALAHGLPARVADVLGHIQQELFDLGADLANPVTAAGANPAAGALRIEAAQVTRLEGWCDEFGAGLPTLRSFVLPGGSLTGGYLHLARTVCRRAERAAWRAVAEHGLAELGGEAAPGVTGESVVEQPEVDGASEEPVAALPQAGRAPGESVPALPQAGRAPGESVPAPSEADRARGPGGPTAAGGGNAQAVTYLNRLSDLLFILSRAVAGSAGETLWVPGGQRDCGTVGP